MPFFIMNNNWFRAKIVSFEFVQMNIWVTKKIIRITFLVKNTQMLENVITLMAYQFVKEKTNLLNNLSSLINAIKMHHKWVITRLSSANACWACLYVCMSASALSKRSEEVSKLIALILASNQIRNYLNEREKQRKREIEKKREREMSILKEIMGNWLSGIKYRFLPKYFNSICQIEFQPKWHWKMVTNSYLKHIN